MKYKLLRLSLMACLALLWGSAFAQAPDETIVFSEMGYSNAQKITEVQGTDVTLTLDKGPSTDPAYYTSGSALRLYNRNIMTVASTTKTIEKVVFTFSGTNTFDALKNQATSFSTGEYEESGSTGTWTGSTSEFTVTAGGTSGHARIQKMEFYYSNVSDTREATTVTLGEYQTTGVVGGSMNLPSATVTTASGTPLNVIPTWESSNTEVASIGNGVINFLAVGTTTIKASYPGDNNTKPSSASFTLTVTAAPITGTITSLKALQEVVTATSTSVTIQFNDVFVTAVKGSNAYLADAQGYGILVYKKDHGLEAGQVLNGTIEANLVLYKGQTEITDFSKDGLTITTTELTPTEKTIDAITAANQSTLVTLKGVTFSNGKLSDGTNEITYYDNFSAGSLEEGATYDITGIVIVFNTTLEIAPRTADDIVKKSSGEQPVDERQELKLSFPEESYEATMGEAFTAPVLSGVPEDFDGTMVYSSSNGDVATVGMEGEVTLKGPGTTVITAEATFSNLYKGSATYTLTVKEASTEEPEELANPYTYSFEQQVFDAKSQTKTLKAAEWTLDVTCEDAEGYFGFDQNNGKGQQFGSSKKAATAVTLSTASIPGTITKIVVNTSGASSIDATIGVKVGDTEFTTESSALTATATDYEFTGSASGTITISWANNSAKAIYVKSIYVEYSNEEPQPVWAWANIYADFTDQSFFTEADKDVVTAGLKMNATGGFTRVAADDVTANAIITGKWHNNDHGIQNFSATVPVEGTVKITFGTCAWGGDVTVKNAEGETVATMNTNTGACYHNDKENNIVSCYYKQDVATTLTISGGAYVPYFAVEKVDPKDVPSDVKFIFDVANSGAVGVGPADEIVGIGKQYTLPKNFTLYKEGYTLTGWAAEGTIYAPGETMTAPDAESLTFTPVFTENEVSLADRDEAVTVKWNFRRDAGAPTVAWQNQDGLVWVAQATVAGKTIDVALPFSTNPGKFANGNWTDWAQVNNGTTFHVPSCKGATISMEAYSNITTTTIDGQSDYTQGQTISYTIAGSAESVDVVIGDGSYYRYIQVVLPKVEQSQGGGESYENEVATIEWPFNDPATISGYTTQPEDAFSTVAVNTGDLTITGAASRSADNLADGVSFIKLKPAGSTTAVQWVAKPAAGLTFTPTKVSMWIQRFGTDAENGVTITAKAGEGETITLGNYTAPRANKSKSEDKYGSASNWTNHVEIELTAAQQAALASGEELTLSATVGVGSTKEGGFSDVVIEGLLNGTKADVAMYTLVTAVNPEEAGSINVYPVSEQYEEGSEVTLTATENFGYDFVNWTDATGAEVSTEAKFKYTMNADAQLTANFVAVNTYELALTVDGTNDYMVTISPEPTMVEGKMMYEEGQAVQLTANQYDGLVTFTNWSDGDTNSSKLISISEDIILTAMYAETDIIAGWDFYTAGGDGRKADFAAQDNDADALTLVNTETGETSGWLDKSTEAAGGYESFSGAAVNWRTGTKNGDVGNWHWQTKVNAEAFTDISVQFQMLYNYNAYQTYNAEYSLDGESWTKFGSATMTGAKQVASFNKQLPTEANNQKDLYIRMLADKTSNVDGAASANDGNTLAMFFITGTPKLVNDGVAPVLVSTVPENNATGVSASGKIVLTFDERVKLVEKATATLGSLTLTPTVSGKTVSFEYKGLEYSTQYTFNLPANSICDLTDNYYVDDITLMFTTISQPEVDKDDYDVEVENVEQLMAAIQQAENRSDKNKRFRIFLYNGTYTIPLYSTTKTVNGYEVPECITFLNSGNISFIGESRDGVIITNGIDKNETFAGQFGTTSKYDGISNSDVFQLRGSGYYWQDLTVETGMDDATGRDLAIHDRGTNNIYKNVGLRGYQDTWTSNNDRGLYYFEGGYVRGRTDYMCGKGDIFWNGVELRQIAGGYAAVPSKPAKYGWVYKNCTIVGEPAVVNHATGETRTAKQVDGNYTLGRPWGSGTPIALFIDTKMEVVPSAIGWNEMSGGWPARFAEYNSMTASGSVIDLSGRKKTFGEGHPNNPVLTAEEAYENSNMARMFGEWEPAKATEQAPTPTNVQYYTVNEATWLKWDSSNYVMTWAVCLNGKVVAFTKEPNFNTSTVDNKTQARINRVKKAPTENEWTVRAANAMGGLSDASDVATFTTGIEELSIETARQPETIYNINGVRVQKAQRGLYIINGKKVVIK